MTPRKRSSGAKIMASLKPSGSIGKTKPVEIAGKPINGIRVAGDHLTFTFRCFACVFSKGSSRTTPSLKLLATMFDRTYTMILSIGNDNIVSPYSRSVSVVREKLSLVGAGDARRPAASLEAVSNRL